MQQHFSRYHIQAGVTATDSAVHLGRYYARGDKEQASQAFAKMKVHAKILGKVVVVDLLAFGVINLGDKVWEEWNLIFGPIMN